jgi:O-antigen/teichoic acid export membrane protein
MVNIDDFKIILILIILFLIFPISDIFRWIMKKFHRKKEFA